MGKRSALPFPTLSLFAIYSATPLLAPISASEVDSAGEARRPSDAALEQSKVLFFAAIEDETISPERRTRLMGTVVGMADFARMLSPGDAPAVRAVHSQKQRMIWLEPEKGILIHASIELPRAPRHSRAASGASNLSTFSPALSPQLEDASLLASLQAAYDRFKLTRGTIRRLLDEQGKESTSKVLNTFWRTSMKGWNLESDGGAGSAFERVLGGVQKSSLSTPATAVQLAPLLAQFAASHSQALPILLHGSSVLSLPSLPSSPTASPTFSHSARPPPPQLTSSDLLALVNYLAALSPPLTTISVRPPIPAPRPLQNPVFKEIYGDDVAAAAATSSSGSSPSKWTPWMSAYLTPPSMPTLPTMPNLPTMPSIPTISIPSMPGLSSSTPERTASATSTGGDSSHSVWGGLKNVSWGSLGLKGHSKKSSQASSLAAVDPVPVPAATDPPPPAPVEAAEATPAEAEATPTEEAPKEAPPESTQQQLPTPALTPAEETSAQIPASSPPPATISAPPPPTTSPPISIPTSPLTSLSPIPLSPIPDLTPHHLDVDALSQAMLDGLITPPSPSEVASAASFRGPTSNDGEEEVHEEEEKVVPILEVFCGPEGSRVEVRRFQRGSLSLALATLPIVDAEQTHWLESRSRRLLEAVESILDLANPTPPLYPHRHLVKTDQLRRGHGWTASEEQHWSGKATVEENEVEAAVFDCIKGFESHPPILETLIRTSSSQWAIGHRTEETKTDVFVVLPPKVGRDGSLIDAADELRKLERAYREV